MNKGRRLFAFLLLLIPFISLSAQTHVSVPVDDPVYYILEQAQLRGLLEPLPAVKPYSRSVVLYAINEILAAETKGFGKLGERERTVLENAKQRFGKIEKGLSLQRGAYHYDVLTKKKGIPFSGDIGIGLEMGFAIGLYPSEDEEYWSTDDWASIHVDGDVGEHFSYDATIAGGVVRAPRRELGTYNTYYDPNYVHASHPEIRNEQIWTYSQPLAYFPYAYERKWDGDNIFGSGGISAGGRPSWPDGITIGSSL
jgi:hypothetical protein